MRQLIVILTVALCCVALQGMGLAQGLLSEERPPQPDILVIALDGLNGGVQSQPLGSCNFYGLTNSGVEQELRAVAAELGQSILIRGYSGYFVRHYSPATNKEELGLEDALQDMDWAKVNWPGTQYIVASGSQGSIFSHLLVAANPDVHFRYLIDLDALCGLWPETLRGFQATMRSDPARYQYLADKLAPYLRANLCVPRHILAIPGTLHTFTDLIPGHVRFNLEIRTTALPKPPLGLTETVATDFFPNIREDGSRKDIYRFIDRNDAHGHLQDLATPSLRWMGETIRQLEEGEAVKRRSVSER